MVANYPWDGNADMATRYEASPDDAAFRHLAGVYAGAHASMAASAEFAGGITNGAAWYPVQQGMQVWGSVLGSGLGLGFEQFLGSSRAGPPTAPPGTPSSGACRSAPWG